MKKILWIEDEARPIPGKESPLEMIFKQNDLDLEIVETCEQAFEKLQTIGYDAVLLDIMVPPGNLDMGKEDLMSTMGGLFVFEKILEGKFKPVNDESLPVVVLSGVLFANVIGEIKKMLGNKAKYRFLRKPIRPKFIIKALVSAMGGAHV